MTTENIKSETFKELNLEEKVTVKNIAGWTVGFKRIESQGEIIAQTQSGNRLFNGTDDRGSHATLYIDDEPTRLEVEFDSIEEKRTQSVLTPELVKKLFDYKTVKSFEDKLKAYVVTRAEKYAIIQIIKKLKLNDFEKIRIVENYTGYKI